MNTDNKKLSTGIAGLDAIFHGGIHTHNSEGNNKGIVMLARGQHGVNKIHLSMQICEGLHDSFHDKNDIYQILNRNELVGNKRKKLKDIKKIIKDSKDAFITNFDEIISSKENEVEATKWKKRKDEFDTKYKQWFSGIVPQLQDVRKTEEIIIPKEINITNENRKSTLQKYYVIPYKTIKEYVLFKNESINCFLTDLYSTKDNCNRPRVVLISLNKDNNLLKNSYYDFYIQRLIRNIRNKTNHKSLIESVITLHSMPWIRKNGFMGKELTNILNTYHFPSITGDCINEDGVIAFLEDIQTGFIYYNGRTHGLHVRHQKGADDTGGMLLCKLEIPDDYKVRIIGKDALNDGVESADGLTTFQKMMRELDKYKDKNNKTKTNDEKLEVDFIMIDGLSRLNEEELAQCPLNALSDKLRSKSKVAIITADKKLLPSEISTDIVLDMEILQSKRSDHQYTALKVSKCLYQKNAYGWHRYKMRNAGIEVIPSIHLQMGQRFLMDDIVTDAVLPINEYPFPFWLNENNEIFEDDRIIEAKNKYEDEIKNKNEGSSKGGLTIEGCLKGNILYKEGVENFCKEIINNNKNPHHVLFVNLDNNRTEFNNRFIKNIMNVNNVHLFNFQPGYIHTDEMLWAIDQQIRAIEDVARNNITDDGAPKDSTSIESESKNNNQNDTNRLKTHYTHVSLVFGDLNYIHYAYPCLSAESLLLPALATYTKKHHMTNYVYATVNEGKDAKDTKPFDVANTELHKKEIETIMQMLRITDPFE